MFTKVIPQGHCVIVERFSKPVRVAQSGLRFFIPGFDKLKDVSSIWQERTNKNGIFIELTEQICDTGSRECFTMDNVKLLVDCVYRWRITDPIKAVYEVDELHKSLKEAVLGEIRSFIGKNELNTVLAARGRISEHVVTVVSETVRRWGVNLTGVEVQELKVDDATQGAMLQQLEAARRAEALKLEAEGKAFAVVQEAEAEKKAAILRAEATSEAIKLVSAGEQSYLEMLKATVGPEAAAKVLIAQKTLDAYKQAVKDPSAKVFLPLSALPSVLTGESAK